MAYDGGGSAVTSERKKGRRMSMVEREAVGGYMSRGRKCE